MVVLFEDLEIRCDVKRYWYSFTVPVYLHSGSFQFLELRLCLFIDKESLRDNQTVKPVFNQPAKVFAVAGICLYPSGIS